MPGPPTTVTSRQPRSGVARSSAHSSWASASRRPTSGASRPRRCHPLRSPTASQPVGDDGIPLALELEGCAGARPRPSRARAGTSTRRAGSRPARRAAGDAPPRSPHRRPRSCGRGRCPFPRRCPYSARSASRASTPYRRWKSSFRRASVSRISTAARTARRASSSWSSVRPKTAMTASPMNFASFPPCRSTTGRTPSK